MSAITLITAAPTFITPEQDNEFASSTPETFTLIRPVLRAREYCSVTLNPPVGGLSTQALSDGTLYVLETALYWWSDTASAGFTVPYKTITLHAISRGPSGPTVYCQVDQGDTVMEQDAPAPAQNGVNGNGNGVAAGEDEDEEEAEEVDYSMIEMTFAPQDPEAVERIFEALSACASLHPDSDLGEEDEDAFIGDEAAFEQFTGEDGEELSEVGRAALDHLESIIVYPPGVQPPHDEDEDEKDESTSGPAQPHSTNPRP